MQEVGSVIVKTIEAEIETRIKSRGNGPYFTDFGTIEKAEAMQAILGRAIRLAQAKSVSAYDLTLYFAEACVNKCIHTAQDAWFEYDLRYAEIEFGGVRSTWGKL